MLNVFKVSEGYQKNVKKKRKPSVHFRGGGGGSKNGVVAHFF